MNACLWMLMMMPIAAGDASDWPFGENRVVNGDFEAKAKGATAPGWTLYASPKGCATLTLEKKRRLQGNASARFAVSEAGGARLLSNPISVTGGSHVLVAYAFRQEGFSNSGQYEGVSGLLSLLWADAAGKGVARQSIGNPYAAGDWRFRDQLLVVPKKARTVALEFALYNGSKKHSGKTIPSAMMVDTVQVRPYTPPPAPPDALKPAERIVEGGIATSRVQTTFIANEQTNRYIGSQWAKAVADPKAERGTAVLSPGGSGPGIVAHSASTIRAAPLGLYRLMLRAKAPNNTGTDSLGHMTVGSQRFGTRGDVVLHGKDFAKRNRYQWFQIDFTSRGAGYWIWRVHTKGKQPWTVDQVRVVPLAPFTDRDLLRLFPGSEGVVDPKLNVKKNGPLSPLLVAGPLWHTFSLPSVFRFADYRTKLDVVWVRKQYSQLFRGFPDSPAKLFEHNLICLCDVDLKSMTLQRRHWLRTFVQRGGGLMVFGGHQSYARGGVAGSLLEDVLSVECSSGRSDWTRPPADATLTPASSSPLLAGLSFAERPRVYFMHETTPKKDAIVVLKVAHTPALVLGRYGKGRVACLLATTHGAPAQGETPFWRWTGWPTLLRNVIWWTTGEDRRFQEK